MRAAGRTGIVVMIALLVAACAGDGTASAPPPISASPSVVPTMVPTAMPTTSAMAAPSTAAPGADVPPVARLSAEGGDAVAGHLASYVWLGAGSDAPWLPGAPIAVGAGEPLAVRLEPDREILTWRARSVPADQTDPVGARSIGEGTGAPVFAAPGGGAWTVEVSVDFGPDVGSASWFWRLDVR